MKTRRVRNRSLLRPSIIRPSPSNGFVDYRLRKLALEPLEDRALLNALGLLGGTVFDDLDRDGIRDQGEPGLADWSVESRPLVTAGQLLHTFHNPAPAQDDQFGRSVTAVGDNLLVGAYQDDTGARDAGAAYLFDAHSGELLQTFLNPTPADDDRFGRSTAAAGESVLIGAYGGSGAAYLFDVDSGQLLQTFLNPTPAQNDQFGRSVAVAGDNVLIGARFDDAGARDAGAAYLFDAAGGELRHTLLNPTPAENDQFGYCVAAVGDNVLVGARYDDTGDVDAGAVYLFDGSTGELLRTFLNPTPDNGDAFGRSVAAVAGDVLVGARYDDTGTVNSGTAYLFDGSTGELRQTFLSPAPTFGGEFGYCVAAAGDNVLVGARADDRDAPGAGAAYLFDAVTGNLLQSFQKPLAAVDDHFGVSVAAVGNGVLVAADGDDTGAENAGSVYLFQGVAGPETTVTDSEGNFHFNDIEPGTYQVRQLTSAGRVQTLPYGGSPYSAVVTGNADDVELEFGVAENRLPSAAADSYQVDEDTTLLVTAAEGVLVNDVDADGDALTAAVVTLPLHGTLTLWPDGSLSYSPRPDYFGLDGFSYRAKDFARQAAAEATGGDSQSVAAVTISVAGVNDPTMAADDDYRVYEDTTLCVPAAGGVLANDLDVDGDDLTASLLAGPSHAALVLQADGSFSYTPEKNFFGTDAFTYVVSDTGAEGAPQSMAKVTIVVDPICDGRLGGVVFEDLDRSGVRDAGEGGLKGWTVELQGFGGDLLQTFVNPGQQTNQGFGRSSVALLGENVLIGAFADETAGLGAGAVYLFDGSTANLLHTFVSPAPTLGGFFGASVAAAGGNDVRVGSSNVLVGAPYDKTTGEEAGAAYLFDGTTGDLLQTFTAPDPGAGNAFGSSVAALGDRVLVGASYDDTAAQNAGAAYLFDVATGQLLQTFLNPTPNGFDAFGSVVAAVGDKVLVGAYRDDTGGRDAGAAYLFDAADGKLLHTFLHPHPTAYDRFGSALAAVGDNLLIGAYGDDTAALGAGAAYLFNATTGNLLHTLSNPTAGQYDYFGSSVAGMGDYALVGAYGDNTGAESSGAVYLFDGETGSLLHTFLGPTPSIGDDFGISLAAADGKVLVGTDRDTGTAHLFDAVDQPLPTTSDAEGNYSFSGFRPGTYMVREIVADGYDRTYPDGSGSHTVIVDNDADVLGLDFGNVRNQPPTAADDVYAVDEDGSLSVAAAGGVLDNDGDTDGDGLEAQLQSGPLHGELTLWPNGSFNYTPQADFHGTDRFTYRAGDGLTESNQGLVTIVVSPLNDAPLAADDAYTVYEAGTLWITPPGVLANDGDVDGDPLTASLAAGPYNGTLELRADGSFGYTPHRVRRSDGFAGTDTFTYRANDGATEDDPQSVATVTITVEPIYHGTLSGTVFDDLDRDAAHDVGEPGRAGWIIELQSTGGTSGDQTVTTTTETAGNYGFSGFPLGTYRLRVAMPEGYGQTFPDGSGVHTINVLDSQDLSGVDFGVVQNDPPVAADDDFRVNEDLSLSVLPAAGVLANDSDSHGDQLTASLISGPANGTLSLQPAGSFTYTPNAQFHGIDHFSYWAHDRWTGSNEATVTITVDPVNDAATASGDAYRVDEDNTLLVAAPGVLTNDDDVDGDELTASVISTAANGTLVLQPDGSFSYTPKPDFFGTDGFTYKAHDAVAGSNVATAAIDVGQVSDGLIGGTVFEDLDRNGTRDAGEPPLHGRSVQIERLGGQPLQTFRDPTFDFGQFGRAVAALGSADGTWDVLVGDYRCDTGQHDAGAAYLFDAVTGELLQTFANPTPAEDDRFGRAVAAVGHNDVRVGNDNVLVGAYMDDTAEEDAGAAYLFDRAGNLLHTFLSPSPNYNDQFGRSVAAVDGNVLIGSRFADAGAEDAGAAFLFDAAGGQLLLTLHNPTPAEDDQFGYCVAALGKNVLVGARGDDTGHYDSGSVYLFDGADGNLLRTFVNPAPDNGDAFGRSIAAVGHNVLVGARLDDTGGEGAGAAYLFDGATGELLHTFLSPQAADGAGAHGEEFGFAVAALGHNVLVGARFNNADGNNDGAAYLFDAVTGELLDTFLPPGPGGNTRFGASVAALGEDVLVGAQYARAAYLFDADLGPAATVTGAEGNYSFTGLKPGTYQIREMLPDGRVLTFPGGAGTHTVAVVGDEDHGGLDFGEVRNDPPTAADDAYNLTEDTLLSVSAPTGVLANDADPDGDGITAALADGPLHGTLLLKPDGSFTYSPAANFFGIDTFTYTTGDPWSDSDPATVVLTIEATVDPPQATDDNYAINDESFEVAAPGVLANDVGLDGRELTASLQSGPTNGTLTLRPDGSFSYTPTLGFSGVDAFTYKANDGITDSDAATVRITVTPIYRGLIGGTVFEDIDRNGVRGGDEPGLAGWTVEMVHFDDAVVVVADTDSDGNYSFSEIEFGTYLLYQHPQQAYFQTFPAEGGVYTITIADNQDQLGVDFGNIHNRLPTATDDGYRTQEDTTLLVAAPGVLSNDTDEDGDDLQAVLADGPLHGTLAFEPDGSFSYTPHTDFFGTDGFSYRADDGWDNSDPAAVILTVEAVNDAPTASDDAYATLEDVALEIAAPGVLANDCDVEGDEMRAVVVEEPPGGTLSLHPDGSFRYTPDADFFGTDWFVYGVNRAKATDESVAGSQEKGSIHPPPLTSRADEASVWITVKPTFDGFFGGVVFEDLDRDEVRDDGEPPLEGWTVELVPLGNSSPAASPFAVTDETGTYNFSGFELGPFKVRQNVADGYAQTSPGGDGDYTISILSDGTISGLDFGNVRNQRPVAEDDHYQADEDTMLSVPAPGVLANDSDPDDDTASDPAGQLTARLLDDPLHGTVTLLGDGSFHYVPDADFHGTDHFDYVPNDGLLDGNAATVTIVVAGVNDGPEAWDDFYGTEGHGVLLVAAPGILANDVDLEGDALTAMSGKRPSHGTLSLQCDGSFSYTPYADFVGRDDFTYKAFDGQAGSDAATVSVFVNPIHHGQLGGTVFEDLDGNGVRDVDEPPVAGATVELQSMGDDSAGRLLRVFSGPAPHAGDFFAYSMAAAGDRVLVGAYRTGEAHLFDAATAELLQSFRNPTPATDNQFGYAVAAVDNRVLVGAPAGSSHERWGDGSTTTASGGAAYLFDGNTGKLLLTLRDPTTDSAGNLFGCSLAIVGDNLLVGAAGDDSGADNAGAAYLFDGASGELLQTFLDPTPDNGESFGISATAVGHNVLIGASLAFDDEHPSPGAAAGAAYLFDATTGELLQTFRNPTPEPNDCFGLQVAAIGAGLGDGRVLIAAPYDDTGARDAGAVYLFDGTSGDLLQTFQKPAPVAYDYFGHGLAATGNNVLVSAPGADAGVPNAGVPDADTLDAGAAYLFDGSTAALLRTFSKPKPEPATYGYFGASVAAVAGDVLVGAFLDDVDTVAAGAAYLFDAGTTFTTSDPQGNYLFTGLRAGTYRLSELIPPGQSQTLPGGDGTYTVDLADNESIAELDFGNCRAASQPHGVVGRYVFYNNSSFDGHDPQPGRQDDAAVADDKTALLPGRTATFANYTSYVRGINGVMIDVAGLAAVPTAADFEFRVGNDSDVRVGSDDDPDRWQYAPEPGSITIRPGDGIGGSDRLTIIWGDNAIQGQWLQVTLRATESTALPSDDVFYFGNAAGDSGNSQTDAKVDAADLLLARNNPRNLLHAAAIDFPYDYNRDARVNVADMLIARVNQTHVLDALRLIAAPGPAVKSSPVGESPTGLEAEGLDTEKVQLHDVSDRFSWSGWRAEATPEGFATAAGNKTAQFRYSFPDTPELIATPAGSAESKSPPAYYPRIEGEPLRFSPGDPIIPSRTSRILLPRGTRIESIDVILGTPKTMATGVDLLAAPPLMTTDNAEDYRYDTVSESFSPGVKFETQFLCGYSIGVIDVFPVAYRADSAAVDYYDQLAITVTTTVVDDPGLLPIGGSQSDARRVLDLIDNGSALSDATLWEATPPPTSFTSAALPPGGPYEYVIITPSELADAFQPLADHRISRGLTATVITTEYIQTVYRSPYPNEDDLAGRVREFLRDAYLGWNTRWVLIGGNTDSAGSPYRYVRVAANGEDKTFLSDMYFACLDGPYNYTNDADWAQRNDGIGGGDVDRGPDVFVGRAPAGNAEEATNFVRKTILYETTPPPNPTTILWLGEKLYSDPTTWGASSSDEIIGSVVPAGYNNETLYERDVSYGRAEVMEQLNAGPNVVHHLGHSTSTGNAKMTPQHPPQLTNEHPYLFYSQGCQSGSFQYESMAEAHTVQAPAAAVAAIFNTHYGWYSPGGIPGGSHWWAREFFDALFNEHLLHVGQAHFDSKTDRASGFGTDRWVFFASSLFGDPQTQIYLPLPDAPTLLQATAQDSSVRLDFSEPMDNTSFDLDDVVSFLGPGGVDLRDGLTGFQWRDFWTLEVFFHLDFDFHLNTSDLLPGDCFELTIAPDVLDRQGTALDADGDGLPGEVVDDRITADFLLPTSPFSLPQAVIYRADMDCDPGWLLQGDWSYGRPITNVAGGLHGDPPGGYSGLNVLGYNLHGSYENNITRPQYAVSPPIDCAAYAEVTLNFQRQLGVEGNNWDHARIDVSADGGQTWNNVWKNGPADVIDADWTEQSLDISAVAAGRANVSIRFGMGPTDSSMTYHGWNVDDLIVTGMPAYTAIVAHAPYEVETATDHVDVTFRKPIDGSTFTTADVEITGPGGPIHVIGIVAITDPQSPGHDQVYRIRFPLLAVLGTYTLTVGPRIEDLARREMDQDLDGLPGETLDDRYTGTFEIMAEDRRPPQVVSHEPSYSAAAPIESVTFTFDEPMDAASFGLDDVAAFVGPQGDLAGQITGLRWLDATTLSISFYAQAAGGSYALTVGPDITDDAPAANPMADEYTANFAIGVARDHDLLGTGFSVTPDNLREAAGAVEVAFSIFNAGANDAGPFSVRFYLSEDDDIDPAEDTLLHVAGGPDHYGLTSGLVSGDSHLATVTLEVPISGPWGDHRGYLGMVVDADDQIAEDDETNNRNRGPSRDLAAVLHVAMREPEILSDPGPGLVFSYYRHSGELSGVEQIDSLTPLATGVAGNFAIDLYDDGDAFAVVYTGYLYVERDDLYTFYTNSDGNSDGGCRIYVGSTLVLDDDRDLATGEPFGQLGLKAGYHPIVVKYYENSGGEGLSVSYESTTADKREIPSAALFHEAGSETDGPAIIVAQPAGEVAGNRSTLWFAFNEPMDTAGFHAADDVVALSGPAGDLSDTVTGYYWHPDRRTLAVQFEGLSMLGQYTMAIGPDVLDASGNPMDQNRNGTGGEPSDDRYTATFTRVNADPSIAFLFGDTTGYRGQELRFTSCADDPDRDLQSGDVLSYSWDFGDGSPLASGVGLRSVSHVFSAQGYYTVALMVDDGNDGSDTATLEITVDDVVKGVAAHDAVMQSEAERAKDPREIELGKLAWLYEFEAIAAKRRSSTTKDADVSAAKAEPIHTFRCPRS